MGLAEAAPRTTMHLYCLRWAQGLDGLQHVPTQVTVGHLLLQVSVLQSLGSKVLELEPVLRPRNGGQKPTATTFLLPQ